MSRTASPVLVAALAIAALGWLGLDLVAVLAQPPDPEPDTGGHCACSGGVCPIGASGRGCTCGCLLKADAQEVETRRAEAAAECADGRAGAYPCHEVDLLASLPLAEIGGGHGNDIWGWTDPSTGHEFAIVGRSNGTAFVDITDPRNPIFVGDLPTHTVESAWRDIKVFADHAFIVSEAPDHGMQVFDLRRLSSVESPPQTFAATAHYGAFGSAHNIAINMDTGFAYAVGTRTCTGGLHIVDVTEPASPRTAGCYALDGYTHDVQCVTYRGPDEAHRGREICLAANEDTLTVVDASDKHAVRQLSRTAYDSSAYTHQGWLTDDQRHFLVDDEGDERAFGRNTRTFVWDVSDLDAPFIRTIHEGPARAIDHNLYVRGDLAYESNYRSGLRVVDLSGLADGSPLREAGFFDIYPADDEPAYNGAWSAFPYFASGNVVVNGIEQGLFVLRPRRAPAGDARGLAVSVAPTRVPAVVGSEVGIVTTVRNSGPAHARGVQLTVPVPTVASLIGARATRGACLTGQVVTCDVGALPPGASAVAVLTVRPSEARDLATTAKVTADPMDGEILDDNTATLTARVEPARRELRLLGPVGGETWRTGRAFTIQWTLRGVDGGVRVELSRDDGSNWIAIADEAANTGFFDWTASGPTARARVRVTSLVDPSLQAASSGAFAIQ
jgi:choice-of-anchor B domain-containing protein